MNLLAEAHAELASQMQEFASDDATYRRGTDSVAIKVTRGKSLLRLTDDRGGRRTEVWDRDLGGQRTEVWDRDFFFPIASLVFNGALMEPLAGDWIDIAIAGKTSRYEVMQPGDNEQAARKTDSDVMWRVHTKFLEVLSV